jgi:hypothetical protein
VLVEILAGVLIGYSVMVVVAVASAALSRRGPRAAPHDRATAGSGASPPTLLTPWPRPDPAPPVRGAGEVGTDAPWTGMRPLDVWDAVALALIMGMVLGVPVVGGVVAALLIPFLLVAPLLVLRFLEQRARAVGRRRG